MEFTDKIISSIFFGKHLLGENLESYEKPFLEKELDFKLSQLDLDFNLENLKLSNNNENINFEERKKLLLYFLEELKVRKLFYIDLLAIEISSNRERAKKKLEVGISYLENYLISFEKILDSYKERHLYLIPKGNILISISSTDPLEGLLNSFVPSFLLGNKIYIKPSRKTSLFIFELFNKLKNKTELWKHICVFIVSNELFQKCIKNNLFDMVYWTGGISSSEEIERLCLDSKTNFYFEGPGGDLLYIDNGFNDFNLFEQSIRESILDNNGKNCNKISGILIHSSVKDEVENNLREMFNKVSSLETIKDDSLFKIGPMQEKEYRVSLEKLKKAKFESAPVSVIQSFNEKLNYFPPSLFLDVDKCEVFLEEEYLFPLVWTKNVKSFEEAQEILKKSNFGLNFTIFSQKINEDFLNELMANAKCGRITLNKNPLDVSWFEPWGGLKLSGKEGSNYWEEKFSTKLYVKNGN